MKEINLNFFGCSFTNLETSLTGHSFTNFRKIIDKKLLINSTDFSKTGKSNEHIIQDVYDCAANQSFHKGTNIFVIQFSFNDRVGMFSDIDNKFVSLCKEENPDDIIDKIKIDFYKDWLKYFYSRESRVHEFKKQVDLICCWLKYKDIKFICIGLDFGMDEYLTNNKIFLLNNNFIKFENTYSLYGYSVMNKLRICDVIDSDISDNHLNKEGHEYLSKKILEQIDI